MKTQVLKAIERFDLIGKEKNVTVALSGGADSMALLCALLELKDDFGITVTAAHLNHMIRGEEALRDEEFVKEQCKLRGVKLFCERADVPLYAKENSLSLELAARKLRYEFLERVSEGVVATAHTASDNLETVIFNLARGSGIDGLCGIPVKREGFIRPLILCSRAQIEDYCKENNIPFVTDSSNLSDDYTRNKIRHSIIPLIKELNPQSEYAVSKASSLLREDAQFINNEAEKFLAENTKDSYLSLEGFKELHPAVAKRVIRKYIEGQRPIKLENIHIEEAYLAALMGGKSNLPANNYAKAQNGKLSVFGEDDEIPQKKVKITECDNTFFEENKKINNLLLNNLLDCDKIIGKWTLRTRRSGDSIRLKGRGCTKTLTRLMSEKQIPQALRDRLPVIADDNGVIWVCELGVAERCAVSKKTKKVYLIEAL